MYVLKEEDTNIIRGIPQIYNDNRNINNRWLQASHPLSSLDPFVVICWYDIPHQIKLITNDTFDLIKDQIRSSRHFSKDPCIPFLPYMIHCSCETQFTRKIDETLAMPRDSSPSNPFIPAFCHSWNVASVINIPPDRFSIGAFKEQVVVILIVAETE
jgi:hypothetical protein